MADNVELDPGTGGATIAADDVSSVYYQRVKLDGGADGASTPILAGGGVEASALRVTLASDSTGVLSVDDNGATLSVDDGAGSLTVDNAALSVTGGGVEASALRVTLASDSTGVVSVDDNGGSLTVDNAALSVTGGGVEASALRVTIASDSTGVVSVDDNGGSITVDGTVAISGTVAVTQSGTWDEVGINDSGNSITVDNGGTFAVQADSVIPGTGATNLGKAEDAAHTTGDVGVMALTVRQNTAAATSGTDGDYQPLISDTNGRLHVLDANSASALTSLQLIDDAVYTDDAAFTPATSKVMAVGAQADETAADSVDEGDVGALRMTLDRMLRVVSTLESNSLRAGTATVTPAFAAIAAASSGNNTLVTNSNGGKKVRVLAMSMVAASAVSLYFTSDNGGTVIHGGSTNKISLAANGGFVLPFNPLGWFETAADHDLVVNLGGAVAVSGGVVYAEV